MARLDSDQAATQALPADLPQLIAQAADAWRRSALTTDSKTIGDLLAFAYRCEDKARTLAREAKPRNRAGLSR